MIRLGSLFSDGAVLQREQVIRIWGETFPNVLVQAEIAGNAAYAKSSGDGSFMLHIAPMDAGGPYRLTVSVPEKGEATTLNDIMIGEVWLCSGQSNMDYRLGSRWASHPCPDESKRVGTIQLNEYLDTVCPENNIRFIVIPNVVTGCREKYIGGEWCPMTRENAPQASAVGAWFGSNLFKDLKVPIGLICCSWGGSIIQTWTSPAALRANPDTRPQIEKWEEMRRRKETWTTDAVSQEERLRKLYIPDRGNAGFGKGWAEPGLDDSDWLPMQIPGSWMQQNIAGNGAIWVRRKVMIPKEMEGKELLLKTGGIDKHDVTYFNGVEIGRTGKDFESQYWVVHRNYKVPGNLVHAGENTIAIRVFSFLFDGGFGPTDRDYALIGKGLSIPLAGEWKAKAEFDVGRIEVEVNYGITVHNTPGLQFDSMIRPIMQYVIKGVIWYQSESNISNERNVLQYHRKMETMVRDWRFHWDLPDLPFIQVQLADFRNRKPYDVYSLWALMRNEQRLSCLNLHNVFMVTALGTGEEDDIHPQNKKDVGRRLAASALHNVYGKSDVIPCGPAFVKAQREGGKLRVYFEYSEGMELRGPVGNGFYLAGKDGNYHPADEAEIDGDSILLSSKQVKQPEFVRYAWSDYPESILWNKEYPAISFSSER